MIKGKKKDQRSAIVELKITQEMRDQALAKGEEMGKLRNSITDGERNTLAFIGEFLVASYIEGQVVNTYEHDILKNGKSIDVKSKNTTVCPKPFYEVSVAQFNTHQDCDYYVFVRILEDLSLGWLLGYMPKQEYYKKSRFLQKGQIDGSNKFVVRADCYNMFIYDLLPISQLLKELL